MVPKPTAIANRPVSFDAESVHNDLVLISYEMDRNCLKTVYGESVLTQIAKIKITGSINGPDGKKKKKKKKKLPARLLVRPWPDQPDRLLRPCYSRGSSSPSRSISGVLSHVADGGSARIRIECVQSSLSRSSSLSRYIHSPEHHVIFHPSCSHHVSNVA